MSFKVRRVVTGHDLDGRAVVIKDDTAFTAPPKRPGATSYNVWFTEGWPANCDGDEDPSSRPIGTIVPGGSVFRVVRYEPGVAPRRHRTHSIDYAVVMWGEIDMELDEESVTLRAGDVLVQRATIHNWVNRGTEPCVIAFVLVDSLPPVAGGRTLDARG